MSREQSCFRFLKSSIVARDILGHKDFGIKFLNPFYVKDDIISGAILLLQYSENISYKEEEDKIIFYWDDSFKFLKD